MIAMDLKAIREMSDLAPSSKRRCVVALAERFGLHINAVGVGEFLDDMRLLEARALARSLMGLVD